MNIFIWRHSKKFSSWSMFNEPHVYDDNYMQAEVVVLANSKDEALDLLRNDVKWNIEELKRIEPKIIALDQPCVVSTLIYFG
ncbi:MAG: hypothetical protein H6R39_115 [Deltaproteobacteria bacterium]|nr:hypothetical protein [Deltaproteobacteria bacterium]